jgi:hypothetical protein
MTDKKITQLTAITGANAVAGDQLAIVDVSDTTMSASGTTKKIALSELQAAPLSAGTANGVAYLNASKVLTSGSALTFDGTDLATTGGIILNNSKYYYGKSSGGSTVRLMGINSSDVFYLGIDSGPISMNVNASSTSTNIAFNASGSEQMRLTSTGLGIGTSSPSASAILDAQSTTKGVRMPNMTTTQKNAIASPAAGLMVFDTTLAKLCVYTGAAWQTITSV